MRQRQWSSGTLCLLLAAVGAVLLLDVVVAAVGLGPLSRHMTTHILLMGAVAPALAHGLLQVRQRQALPLSFPAMLLSATLAQLALLWGWHAPPALEFALGRPLLHLAMQAMLLAGALWFWLAVFAKQGSGRWQAMLALLVTGKLFCLLGVVLVFAPRALYALDPGAAHGAAALAPGHALADQQLAGLLMLTACPLTYLVAGVAIAARWLTELGAADHPNGPGT